MLMKVKSVKVSDKGQIAIPQEMREGAGIHKGDEIIIIQEGDKIMIKKSESIGKGVKDEFHDLLKHSEEVAKNLWGNKKDEIWNSV